MSSRPNGSGMLVLGVGLMDMPGEACKDKKHTPAYMSWRNMLLRCFDPAVKAKHPTYNNATCCKEWLKFSVFKKWFDKNHIQGYHLDKDILVPGNSHYSPKTCVFVPMHINSLLTDHRLARGSFPIGVSKDRGRYVRAALNIHGRAVSLGTFESIEIAAQAYRDAKATYVMGIAIGYPDIRIANGLRKHAEIISMHGTCNFA